MDKFDENGFLARAFGGVCPKYGSEYPLIRVVKNQKEYDTVVRRQYFHNITFECVNKNCSRFFKQRWKLRLPANKYWDALKKSKQDT